MYPLDDVDDDGQPEAQYGRKRLTSLGQYCQDSPREIIGDGDDDVMVLVDIAHLVNNAIDSAGTYY